LFLQNRTKIVTRVTKDIYIVLKYTKYMKKKDNIYNIGKNLGLEKTDIDNVLSAKSRTTEIANTPAVDVYKAGTRYGTLSSKELYKAGTRYGVASQQDIYKDGTYYGVISHKELYKAGTRYGTISPKDLYKSGNFYATISPKDIL